MAYRIYIERDDGTWQRLPHKVVTRPHADHTFEEFSGSVRRAIDMMYEPPKNGSAPIIRRLWGSYYTFDEDGRPDWGMARHADLLDCSALELIKQEGSVISLERERKKRAAIEKSRWELGEKEREMLRNDLQPTRKASRG